MLKTAIRFGVPAGIMGIGAIILGLALSGGTGFLASVQFGFLTMLVGLSLIFIGIKRYRDRELGGTIKFISALILGIAIAAVAGIAYTVIWEVYQFSLGYPFIDQYTAGLIDAKKAQGIDGPALDALIAEMEELKANYAKPYFRWPMTFIEIFPVGLIVAVISAATLRNPNILPARQ